MVPGVKGTEGGKRTRRRLPPSAGLSRDIQDKARNDAVYTGVPAEERPLDYFRKGDRVLLTGVARIPSAFGFVEAGATVDDLAVRVRCFDGEAFFSGNGTPVVISVPYDSPDLMPETLSPYQYFLRDARRGFTQIPAQSKQRH